MNNFDKIIGFEAINNFTAKKKIELESSNGTKVIIGEIPVFISIGAKFSKVLSDRTETSFSFHPYGIISPGEKNIITKEELDYLVERKMIKFLF